MVDSTDPSRNANRRATLTAGKLQNIKIANKTFQAAAQPTGSLNVSVNPRKIMSPQN